MIEEVKILEFEWEKKPEITDEGIVSGKIKFKDGISFNKFMKIKKESDFILIDEKTYNSIIEKIKNNSN